MPIYEYLCEKCRKKTEVIQRIGERPLRVCPHCGGKLKKAISAPAIQFKGSGFYITDYARASGEGGGGKSESKTESKSESKSETKSESAGKSEKVEKKEKKEKKAAKE
ncbi:MAG TPA: FmdB family zinc ribbon protein [Thermoanaerobaculia bacterium]|nr:FmdB family zinc ribbon protein [Thermoanaerobaculia bacterium]